MLFVFIIFISSFCSKHVAKCCEMLRKIAENRKKKWHIPEKFFREFPENFLWSQKLQDYCSIFLQGHRAKK